MVLLKSSAANMTFAESRNMLPRIIVVEQHPISKFHLKKHHPNTSELKTNPLNIQSVDGATLPKTLYE